MLMDEVLRRYLTDTAYTATGIDSALAVLAARNLPAYAADQTALEALLTDFGSSSRPAAPAVPPRAERAPAAATAAVGRRDYAAEPATDYEILIRALLAPLGQAPQIRAALLQDANLHGELEAMAADSLTPGFTVARTALRYYLGYQYPISNPGATTPDDLLIGQRTKPAPPVELYPNPTSGTTDIICRTWPTGATSGVVRLYDHLGAQVRVVKLTARTETAATLDVRGLRPGLYRYVVQLGEATASRGTLLVQP